MKKLNEKNTDRMFVVIVTLLWFAQYVFMPFLSPHLAAIGIAASTAGVIIGAYGMSQMILRIPISVGEDCVAHHKWFMTGGLAVMVLSGVCPLVSDSAAAYFFSRLLSGVGASTWVSFSVSFTGGREDGKARMGLILAASNLGILISYIVGGLVKESIGVPALFGVNALASLIALLLLPLCGELGTDTRHKLDVRKFLSVFLDKHLVICSLMAILVMLISFATAMSFANNYAEMNGATGFALSMVAVMFYLAGTIFNSLYSRGLFSRMSDRMLLAWGFGIMAFYCAIMPMCHSLIAILIAQFVGGIGRAIGYTHLMAICNEKAAPDQKTTAMGVFQSLYSIGTTLGPVVMGLLIDMSGGSYGFAFRVISALSLGGMVWSLLAFKK